MPLRNVNKTRVSGIPKMKSMSSKGYKFLFTVAIKIVM